MHTTDGMTVRATEAGMVVPKGKRELYLLGTSVAATKAFNKALATKSFNQLFNAARRGPDSAGRNTRYLKYNGPYVARYYRAAGAVRRGSTHPHPTPPS